MNGSRKVTIKSLHGKYEFNLRRILKDGKSSDYLRHHGHLSSTYESKGLRAFYSECSNELNYRKLERLINERSGANMYTARQLGRKVEREAISVSAWKANRYNGQQLCLPFVDTDFDR
ncbi:MAG: hypothetical protein AAF599_04025 [Bacteroidota bacterium]